MNVGIAKNRNFTLISHFPFSVVIGMQDLETLQASHLVQGRPSLKPAHWLGRLFRDTRRDITV